MTPLFGQPPVVEEETAAPAPEPVVEQSLSVAALENDDGVKTATYNSIQSSLYDLADTRSRTSKLMLPNGTMIRLASSTSPNRGAYNATYEVTAKGGDPQIVQGNTAATDLAHKCDLLSLTAKERASLMKLSEGQLHERAQTHLPKLQEKQTHVSGYVTKGGRHVGAYSQIRKIIGSLKKGETAHFPEGIKVQHVEPYPGVSKPHYKITGPGKDSYEQPAIGDKPAARIVGSRSASSTHPKSLGGAKKHNGVSGGNDIDEVPAADELTNFDTGKPKVPSTPESRAGSKRLGEDLDAADQRATGKELRDRAAKGDQRATAEIDRRAAKRADRRGKSLGTGSRVIPGPRGPEKLPQGDPRKPAGTGFQKTPGGDAVRAKDLNTGDTINFEGHDWKVKQITGGGGKPVNSVNVVPIKADGSEGSVPRTLEPHEKLKRVGKSKLGDLSGKGAVPGAKRTGGDVAATRQSIFNLKQGETHEMENGVKVKAERYGRGHNSKGTIYTVSGGDKSSSHHTSASDAATNAHARKASTSGSTGGTDKGGAAKTIDRGKRGGLIGRSGGPPKA